MGCLMATACASAPPSEPQTTETENAAPAQPSTATPPAATTPDQGAAEAQAAAAAPMPPPSPADVARPAPPAELAAAHVAVTEQRWKKVLEELAAAKDAIRRGPIDLRIHAEVMEGLAHQMLGDEAKATASYRKALGSFAGASKKLQQQIGKQDDERITAMSFAFGEALFQLAEAKRVKVDAIELPPYDGDADPAKVKKYFESKVGFFVRQREKAIADAMKEYAKVEAVDPPPEAWLVAVAARKAQMADDLHDTVEAMKAPPEWAQTSAPVPAAVPAAKAPPAKSPAAPPTAPPAPAAGPAAGEKAKQDDTKQALEAFQSQRKATLDALAAKAKEAYVACEQRAAAKDTIFARYCMASLGKPVPKTPPPKPQTPKAAAPKAAAPATPAKAAPPAAPPAKAAPPAAPPAKPAPPKGP